MLWSVDVAECAATDILDERWHQLCVRRCVLRDEEAAPAHEQEIAPRGYPSGQRKATSSPGQVAMARAEDVGVIQFQDV